jgi:hypothetical protein
MARAENAARTAVAVGQHTVGGAGSAESASGIVDSVRTSEAASSSAAVAAAATSRAVWQRWAVFLAIAVAMTRRSPS